MTQANVLAQLGSPGISTGFKNRIINGAMRIDQRGAVASTDGAYVVDRFAVRDNLTSGTFTAQQSTTAPTGFNNSLLFTTGTAGTAGASQQARFTQAIEGNNIADLGWGSASAKTITVSFWVRSSLTGTFAGGLRNNNADRSYVFNYTVSSANTFEYKTVTIAGDTSGTWETGTSQGINLIFDLGSGSNFETTAGSWSAGNYFRTSGAVSIATNAGATFYITGVQLEVGTSATDFEYRPYGTELALCQRYCVVFRADGSTGGYSRLGGAGLTTGGVGSNYNYSPSVPFRAVPSFTAVGGTGSMRVWNGTTLYTVSSFSVTADSTNTVINYDVVSGGGQTSNDPVQLLYYNTTSSSLNTVLSAEL